MSKTAYLKRYRNGQYLQFMKDVVAFVNKQDVAALLLTKPLNDLELSLEEITTAYKQSTASPYTKEVTLASEARNNAFRALKYQIQSYTYHQDEVKKAHATVLLNIMKVYGSNILQKSYQETTADIGNFIADLETGEEAIAAVVALGIEDWVLTLKEKNSSFLSLYLGRVANTVATGVKVAIRDLRVATDALYNVLLSFINSYGVVSDNVAYTILLAEIDELIAVNNTLVNKRSNDGAQEVDDTTDNDATEEVTTEAL